MKLEPKNWVNLGFALTGILFAFVMKQVLDTVWGYTRWPLFDDYGFTLPALIAVVLGVILFLVFKGNDKVNGFSTEVVLELSKVTYPARKETLVSAVVVIVMVGIASLLLFLFDSLWGTLTQQFFTI